MLATINAAVETLGLVVSAFGSGSGQSIAKAIQDFVAPLLFLGVGIAAMTFLFRRQMSQFAQFAAIAVLIGAFWFAGEDIIKGVGEFIGSLVS